MVTQNSSNENYPNSSIRHNPHTSTFSWAIGVSAAPSPTASGSVIWGDSAYSSITSSASCVAIGYEAAQSSTAANLNTSIGTKAFNLNTSSGANSLAVGYEAGQSGSVFDLCVAVGSGAGMSLAADATCVGYQCATSLNTSNDTAVGYQALSGASATGAFICAFGYQAMQSATTTGSDVAFGYQALNKVLTGGSHTCVGYQAGYNYNGSEANNICLGNGVTGTTSESNVMRLGSPSNVTTAYLAGVAGVTVTNQAILVLNSVTGQLGQISGKANLPGGISTLPVASSTATAAYVTTLTAGSGAQNTTGYDLMCNVTVVVTAAAGSTLTYGVGTSATPTENTIIPTFTGAGIFTFSAYVPNTYYLIYDYTGTTTIGSVTVQSCAI